MLDVLRTRLQPEAPHDALPGRAAAGAARTASPAGRWSARRLRRRAASRCAAACPTGAAAPRPPDGAARSTLGRCLFCRACERACPHGAIALHAASTAWPPRRREDLIVAAPGDRAAPRPLRRRARRAALRPLAASCARSRAGGCNACEADTNVLGTVAWDLGRFGIQFVASPRHADGLLITGPVTAEHAPGAARRPTTPCPTPKIVIAVGACAISGGPYVGHPESPQRRGRRRARGPLHPRLPAAPADDPRRPAALSGPNPG